ncbi:MAG TPA: methyltransferase domain-containing protein [Chitinophagaceae bacterium]|nr:methyltransferase domain-containing protein [Chitinophagaceae bacterium]
MNDVQAKARADNNEWFRQWFDSPYYHQLYFNRNEQEASAFINRLTEKLQPAAGSFMLDAGCGRGRHARTLAAKGFDVTGIDLSISSINFAKQYESENLHFFQHDMRLPFRVNYFDYVFNLFTSFGYFKSERENDNVIRSMASGLKEGGILVVDYLNVHYAEDHLVHQSEVELEGITFFITKWYDETHFYKKIVIEDEALEEPLEFTEKVAKFSLGDFNDMFAFHELQLQEVYGDYQFGHYDVRKSPRLLMIAKKIIHGTR